MTLDDHISTIKSSLQSLLVNVAMVKIASVMPLPTPVRNIVESLISRVIGFFLDQTELKAFFVYTDFRTSKQGNEFYQAAINNQRAQQEGTDEEKRLAEEDLIKSFNSLVKLTS